MCLWCDLSTHLGDQDWGAGTSHGHFLRRYWGFFFLSLCTVCCHCCLDIFDPEDEVTLKYFSTSVLCHGCRGYPAFGKKFLDFFYPKQKKKKSNAVRTERQESDRFLGTQCPVAKSLQPWKTWLLQIMGTICRAMWTWYTIGSTQTTFRATLSYGQLCRVFLWVFQSADPRNCCLLRKSFPFCEICSHRKLEWDV